MRFDTDYRCDTPSNSTHRRITGQTALSSLYYEQTPAGPVCMPDGSHDILLTRSIFARWRDSRANIAISLLENSRFVELMRCLQSSLTVP